MDQRECTEFRRDGFEETPGNYNTHHFHGTVPQSSRKDYHGVCGSNEILMVWSYLKNDHTSINQSNNNHKHAIKQAIHFAKHFSLRSLLTPRTHFFTTHERCSLTPTSFDHSSSNTHITWLCAEMMLDCIGDARCKSSRYILKQNWMMQTWMNVNKILLMTLDCLRMKPVMNLWGVKVENWMMVRCMARVRGERHQKECQSANS